MVSVAATTKRATSPPSSVPVTAIPPRAPAPGPTPTRDAAEELSWLRTYVLSITEDGTPRSAVEGYARALILRDGPCARVYLAPAIRDTIPPFAIGLSHPRLAPRHEILSEQKLDDATSRFVVRYYTDSGSLPLVPGPTETYTVRKLPDDFGNRFWLIAEITR